MITVLSIVAAILALGVIIMLHEVGHFLSARAVGIEVMEFALGFGPKLFSVTDKKGTVFSLRLLPIGGFCSFYGEDADLNDKRAYNNQPVWKRLVSVVSGPLMNFIAAFIIAVVILTMIGEQGPVNIVGEVSEGSPAQTAGLQKGDILLAVDGMESSDTSMLSGKIAASGDAHTLLIERDGALQSINIIPFYDQELNRYRVGFTFDNQRAFYSFSEALGISVQFIWRVLGEMLSGLGRLVFRGEGAGDVVGPVGTVTLISETARQGMDSFLRISLIISLNLGLINLLPLPALDGGRIIFLIIEGIRRKPVKREREAMVHLIGLALLMVLMLIVTGKDILGLIGWS